MQHRYGSIFRTGSALAGLCLFVMALVLAACGSPDVDPPGTALVPPAEECAPGELTRPDGTCLRNGVPSDMLCPPGELPLDDGTCQKAGVPPSACGVGFVPDGKDGCEPILPADTCPAGQMAIPGDTACREVAPCGSGTWGDIPIEANTQFVDKAYAGGTSDGTKAHPWTSIQQGVKAAAKGAIVAVAAGSYAEDVLIQGKPVRLWGRCPAMVEIAGAGVELGAIRVFKKAADGTRIRSVAVTRARAGIIVSGTSSVVIEQVWVHGTEDRGINIQDTYGGTSVVLKGSLVEKSYEAGVFVAGSDATIETTVVRSTQPNMQGMGGRGINIEDNSDTMARANVTVRACLIDQNQEVGVFVGGSDATIEAIVVRSTLPEAQGKGGFGINIEDSSDTMARANVTVRACLIDQNQGVGVLVWGSDATIEATVVRSTLSEAQGKAGFGIQIGDNPYTMARANVTVRACLVEQNDDVGIFVAGSDTTIEGTVVRSTLPDAQGTGGYGIFIQDGSETKARANVTVRACLVEQNSDVGVVVLNSDATIETTEIRSTLYNANGMGGYGIGIQSSTAAAQADVTVRACLIEQNQHGVIILLSNATIEATTVRDSAFGDGIVVQESNVTIQNAEVTQNARAGVANFGGHVVITGGVFTCNVFDLDYETINNVAASFDGSSGWQCSKWRASNCNELGGCKAVTTGIEPPPPLPEADPIKP